MWYRGAVSFIPLLQGGDGEAEGDPRRTESQKMFAYLTPEHTQTKNWRLTDPRYSFFPSAHVPLFENVYFLFSADRLEMIRGICLTSHHL